MNMALRRCDLESPEQVQSICARLFGTSLRGLTDQGHLKTPQWKVSRVIQMRAEGRIIREIAEEVGISKSTVVEIIAGMKKGEK